MDRQQTWILAEPQPAPGVTPEVHGAPVAVESPYGPAMWFDGLRDGLVFDVNPLCGARRLTLEALFMPAAHGAAEQRFVHVQANGVEDRLLLETRMPSADAWYADTYVWSAAGDRFLNDPALKHAPGGWHTMAMTVADGRMAQYVDGRLELEAPVPFAPLGVGRVAVGMRINQVFHFRGAIRLVRLTPEVLPAAALLVP